MPTCTNSCGPCESNDFHVCMNCGFTEDGKYAEHLGIEEEAISFDEDFTELESSEYFEF